MWIVCWEDQTDGIFTSEWATFESREDAEQCYQDLLEDDNTYTASICAVVKSTDYDAVEAV